MSDYANGVVMNAGVMTGANVIYGSWTTLMQKHHVSYEFVWTGTPTGSIGFEVTNTKREPSSAVAGQPLSTAAASPPLSGVAPAGVAGSCLIGIPWIEAGWIRPVYTNTSGVGSLTITVFAKE